MKLIKLLITPLIVISFGCNKKPQADLPQHVPLPAPDEKKDILSDISTNVIYASYSDLADKSNSLYETTISFTVQTSADNLSETRALWKALRSAWAQSEGFLFGPVVIDNIKFRIDSWPVRSAAIDSIMASSATFTASYIDGLAGSLKGFHAIEYLLFGQTGDKNETQFTARQKDLLVAFILDLRNLCEGLKTSWDPAVKDNYSVKFAVAASGNTTYATQSAAYEELVNAMSGVCDDLANNKIKKPFEAADPAKEESPFSKNSIIDFTDNLKSVQNVYLGKYVSDGKGLEDLIKPNNVGMDNNIKTKITNALSSLNSISLPFGQAISNTNGQRAKVQNAMDAINDLKNYLQGDVKTYVKTLMK